jgi:hypothetical protein
MDLLPDFKKFVESVFGKKNPTKPPLVEVLWLDASDIENGWFGHEEIQLQCAGQIEFMKKAGKEEKFAYCHETHDLELKEEMENSVLNIKLMKWSM